MLRSRWIPFALLSLSLSARAAGPFDAEVAARRAEAKRLAGTPRAIVPLLGILDLWTLVDDRAAVAAFLDEVAGDPRQRQDVRGRAAYLRSVAADRLGDFAGARAMRERLGFVTEWQVLGPFDNEGKSGHAKKLAPEQDLAGPLDLTRAYEGVRTVGPLRWRLLPGSASPEGLVTLDTAIRPDSQVTAYASAFVRADAPVDAALHLGSSGAIKVWVNGALAFERDVYRPVRVDQDVAVAHLGRGWNRVTVKLGVAEGAWGFFLRLTGLDGAPIHFTAGASREIAAAFARQPAVRSPPRARVADLGAELRRGAASPKDAEAARALGVYLFYVSPEDPEKKGAERELERAARLAPSTGILRLLAGASAEPNERRKHLEEALALAGKATPAEKARVLSELAEIYARVHRERRAEELWRDALAAEPEHVPAAIRLAELSADRGLPAQGLAMLEPVAVAHPAIAVLSAQASLLDRRGQRTQAAAIWQRLRAATADDLGPLRELFAQARSSGDLAGALALSDAMARARPDLHAAVLDRAELLEGNGRGAEAHAALAGLLAICPDDPRLIERDGRVLHRLGREEEALAAFRRALELRPQNPELRAYARLLEGGGKAGAGDDLAREFTRAVPELIVAAHALVAGHAPDLAGESARVLLDASATRVHANGLSETFTQRVVEILDQRGAREQGDVDIKYTPDTQSVEVKAARVYKRGGEVVEASAQTDRDLSEPWYGLYYDVRAEILEFPHLEPGDVIDVEYVVSDVGRKNILSDYYGDLHLLQEDIPRRESAYVLIAPKARPLYFNEPKLGGLTVEKKERGDEIEYRYRALDVPKIVVEPGMPGFTEVAAYVHVSTYKSWEEVAAWYWGLAREQLEPDDAIRRAVARAVAGVTDERKKIQKLYDLVVKQTRYVGLEFGIHGYKPYKVTQVFARRFGDCKDKASLLVAMLKEIHVDATLVLARTRRGGDLAPFPASLAPFDHAIAYVPKYELFLDGTAEFSGSIELPAQDQDIPVLLVNPSGNLHPGGGRLARTPVLPPERNRVSRELRVALRSDGAARVDLKMAVSGEAAHEWRSHYQTPGERRERFEKAENQAHPGARVIKADFASVEDLEKPVEVGSQMEVPVWARIGGPGSGGGPAERPGDVAHDAARELSMPAFGREGELSRSYARLSERRHDLVLGYPWEQEERVRIALPAGFTPRRLPEARRIETPFGSFTISVEHKGQEVSFASALRVTRHRIARAEYPAFRRFCLDVDAAAGQELVVAHE